MELQIFLQEALISLREILELVPEGINEDIITTRIESIIISADDFQDSFVVQNLIHSLGEAIEHLSLSAITPSVGPPILDIPKNNVEMLLSLRFTVTDIARLLGLSRRTLCRRLQNWNMQVRTTYTSISKEDLERAVLGVISDFKNAGYKQVAALLLNQGIKVTERDIRNLMREVDPHGVYYRTRLNRTIKRRQYFVTFSNEMWHIDSNLKLIRWKMVVRSGIDGKSRTCLYLNCGTDNTANSHLQCFLQAVERFGIPSRCRSDKGRENVSIAKFMLDSRGLGRASHICGRSVHNQRIERYWRDVFHQTLSLYYDLFTFMERTGRLNMDLDFQIAILHYIFIPRINTHLRIFMEGWNNHPMRTEKHKTPYQIFLLNLPPPDFDLTLSSVHLLDEFALDTESDLDLLEASTIASPEPLAAHFSGDELRILQAIDPLQTSNNHGIDLYDLALRSLVNVYHSSD